MCGRGENKGTKSRVPFGRTKEQVWLADLSSVVALSLSAVAGYNKQLAWPPLNLLALAVSAHSGH